MGAVDDGKVAWAKFIKARVADDSEIDEDTVVSRMLVDTSGTGGFVVESGTTKGDAKLAVGLSLDDALTEVGMEWTEYFHYTPPDDPSPQGREAMEKSLGALLDAPNEKLSVARDRLMAALGMRADAAGFVASVRRLAEAAAGAIGCGRAERALPSSARVRSPTVCVHQ